MDKWPKTKTLKHLVKIAVLLIIFLAATQALNACTPQPVKVAVIAKLESGSIMGMSTWDQVKFYNERHPITARKIEFHPYGDDGTREGLTSVYEALRKDGIEIIITAHKSDSAMWLKELVDQDDAKILVLAAGSTTDQLEGKDDEIIRFVQSARYEQEAASQYIKDRGYEKPVIIRDIENYSYANSAMEAFADYFARDFHWFDVKLSGIDFAVLEKQLSSIDYDIAYLLISDYNISAGAVAQMVLKVNPDAKVLYNAWMKTQALLDTAGNSLNQSAMLSHYPANYENPVIEDYLEAYQNTFSYVPNTIGITVYRIVDALSIAIGNGHKNPESIKAFMLDQGTIETELLPVVIDQYGDTQGPFYYLENLLEAFK